MMELISCGLESGWKEVFQRFIVNTFSFCRIWGMETYKFMHKLWLEGEEGVSLLPAYLLYRSESDLSAIPSWRQKVFGFHLLNEKQLKYLSELYSNQYGYKYK